MTREIPLTRDYVALVDDGDYERLSRHLWQSVISKGYVYGSRSWREGIAGPVHKTYIHREVMRAPKGFQVRFRSKNTLDCRRSNLTLAGSK